MIATLLSLLLLCQGHVQPPPLVSWWCIDPAARVQVTGAGPNEWGLNVEPDAPVAVLWAQGWWSRVEVDGEVRGMRVWLPVVGQQHGVVGNE